MNQGPLIFLGVFCALALSWFGMVFQPQLQLGRELQSTNVVNTSELYPAARPGDASQGLQVYRSLGCAACHSQQVRESGRTYDVVLTGAGTNETALIATITSVARGIDAPAARKLLVDLPATVLKNVDRTVADSAVEKLQTDDAKAGVRVVPFGPDIARGWGKRRTVAADFLFDQPVMPGSQRLGPDLANLGLRQPSGTLLLLHLFNPRAITPGSVMPPYPFLFERRKIGMHRSPDALPLGDKFAPEPGYEIVPSDKASALVAYLLDLRADVPVFESPLTPPIVLTTNAPATNAPVSSRATNAPTK